MKRNAKSSHSSKNNIKWKNIKLPTKNRKTQGVEQQRP
jgi:hypothetical protein